MCNTGGGDLGGNAGRTCVCGVVCQEWPVLAEAGGCRGQGASPVGQETPTEEQNGLHGGHE